MLARRPGRSAGHERAARHRRPRGAASGRARRDVREREAAGGERAPSRATPRRSSSAVRTTSTRLSGSSTQSTGTSWMRSPARSASTSSSVSKNQPVSCTNGSSRRRDVAADRFEPALGVAERRGEGAAQQQVVAARDQLARGPRRTRADGSGACRSRRRSARRPAVPRAAAARPGPSTGRRPCRPGRRRPTSTRPRPGLGRVPSGEVHHPDVRQLVREPPCDVERAVGARVVGDRDAERVRELARQVRVQTVHRLGQHVRLVVHRHDDLEQRVAAGHVRPRPRRCRGHRHGDDRGAARPG